MNTQADFFLEKENYKLLIYNQLKDTKEVESFNRKINFHQKLTQKKKYYISLLQKYIEGENLPNISLVFSKRKQHDINLIKNEIKISENIFNDYFIFFETFYIISLYKMEVIGIDKNYNELTLFLNDIISRALNDNENFNQLNYLYKGHSRKMLNSFLLDNFNVNINNGVEIESSFKEHKIFKFSNGKKLILYSKDLKKYNLISI